MSPHPCCCVFLPASAIWGTITLHSGPSENSQPTDLQTMGLGWQSSASSCQSAEQPNESTHSTITSRMAFVDCAYFFFLDFFLSGLCVNAEPAALLAFFEVLLLRRSPEAILPTRLLVFSFFPMSLFLLYKSALYHPVRSSQVYPATDCDDRCAWTLRAGVASTGLRVPTLQGTVSAPEVNQF